MADPEISPVRSGEALFLSHLELINEIVAFICRRHHLSALDADEFASHVKLKLIEDDYRILRQFQGRSGVKTYLCVVLQRQFLDYRIAAWGKWRPSSTARKLGPLALLLERLLVRDNYSLEQALEILITNHRVTITRGEVEALAARLVVPVKRRVESEDALVNVIAQSGQPDASLLEAERADRATRVARALRDAMTEFDEQSRLILLMRFEDGRTVAEIARALSMDQKALYRRLDRLLKELRGALQARQLDAAAVLDMLESPVAIDWSAAETESAPVRPSSRAGVPTWRP